MGTHPAPDRLMSYVHGGCSGDEAATIGHHCSTCDECRRRADELRRIDALMRAAACDHTAPDMLAAYSGGVKLSGRDRDRIEAHLAFCSLCQEELALLSACDDELPEDSQPCSTAPEWLGQLVEERFSSYLGQLKALLARLVGARAVRRGVLDSREAEVMEPLWEAPEALSAHDVHRRIAAKGRSTPYASVVQTLGRLSTRGYVAREAREGVYHHTARVKRTDIEPAERRRSMRRLLQGIAEPAMAYLVEALSDTDADKLDVLHRHVEAERRER